MGGISVEWIILYVILIFFCFVVLFGIAGQLDKIINPPRRKSYLSNIEKKLDDIYSGVASIKSELESLRLEGITITKEPPMDWGD